MRGAFGLLRKPSCIGSTTSPISSCIAEQGLTPLSSYTAAFSTSSGGDGSGRGRGRGSPVRPQFQFTANDPEKPKPGDPSGDPTHSVSGRGHGRGKPLPSSPFLPSFNTFVAPHPTPSPEPSASDVRRDRGDAAIEGNKEEQKPKRPVFLWKDGGESSGAAPVNPNLRRPIGEANLPDSLLGVLSGMGRGKPVKQPAAQPEEENRHLRRQRGGFQGGPARARRGEEPEGDTSMDVASGEGGGARRPEAGPPRLSREEAKKKAIGILSKGGRRGREESVEEVRGRADDGGRKRGRRQRDREEFGREGERRERQGVDAAQEAQEDEEFHLGDDADGEKFAQKVGPEVMNALTERFEEMSYDVLPSVVEDEFLEAMDTNLKIELEPEYLMADFETNPDIDEKPPIPLRDALEKMKPFLMVYEGIQNEEEWKEVVEDTMKRVPLLKEIVDYYAGPDTVTAKQQQEELERVAKMLPASTPDSVRRFTDRAVLTLQSNPGWGFDKKCQFMDKLVAEVSQVYK